VLAEIVTVGDELVRGEIVNTNSSWLAEALWERQVTVARSTSCRDLAPEMSEILSQAAQRSDIVLVSGGLGPTLDDLTVDVICQLVGAQPQVDPRARKILESRFRAAGMDAGGAALRQVRVPRGARVFDNAVGLAPGFEVELHGAAVICLPGPPRELHAIFGEHVAPRIAELREGRGEQVEQLARRIYRCFGAGESGIAAKLEGLELPAGGSLHFQVKFPETLVKVVVRGTDAAEVAAALEGVDSAIRDRLGLHLYGTDDDSLAGAVGRMLARHDHTFAVAESCTGGLLGGLITAVPGSSRYFLGGVIVYANSEKQRQLGVSPETLEREGAVSEACVIEMVTGLRERMGTSVAVAISGIAGPSGGSEDRPVGTVWVAVSGPGNRQRAKCFFWPTDRDRIRLLAAHWALALVRRSLLEDRES